MGLSSLSTGIANSLTPEAMQYSVFNWFYNSENLLFFGVGYMLYHYGSILLAAYFINLAFRD